MLYDEALRLDPNFLPALLGRFNTLHWELYENLDADRARFVAEMDLLSRRAVALDDQNPSAWGTRVDASGWLGRWDEAFTADEKAQTLDPAALVFNLEDMAWLKYATGRPVETIALTERAIAIDPPGKLEEAMNMSGQFDSWADTAKRYRPARKRPRSTTPRGTTKCCFSPPVPKTATCKRPQWRRQNCSSASRGSQSPRTRRLDFRTTRNTLKCSNRTITLAYARLEFRSSKLPGSRSVS